MSSKKASRDSMPASKIISQQKLFAGQQIRVEHESSALNCTMRFSVYLPPGASVEKPVPALYFLAGLTCTDDNFSTKSGAQRIAAELGIALVMPDTSPRGDTVPDDDAYDLGQGAGFYLNATRAPWNGHYHMFDYIAVELPAVVNANFPINEQKAISGHSMGGHGAISIATKLPDAYCSVSAFAPIVNPVLCPWGKKAFTQYLGEDQQLWQQHDSVELITSRGLTLPLLVDQGTADDFLAEQLLTDNLIAATRAMNNVTIRYQQGYDHSYYFIATFIEQHLRFHAEHLHKRRTPV